MVLINEGTSVADENLWSHLANWVSIGMVVNPARGQMRGGGIYIFPVYICAQEFDFAKHVPPSHPASARPFSTPRENLVRIHGLLRSIPLSTTAPTLTVSRHRVNYYVSGHTIAPRWRLPESVRWCRAGSPHDSSSDECAYSGNPMDPFLCAYLLLHPLVVKGAIFHTEYRRR